MFEPGTILADKYRVERVLGEGGMGVVLEAVQVDLERHVAIKLMHTSDRHEREESLARFRREAKAAAKLRGDHVVRVLDVGKLDADTPYMVMELLEGADLRSTLDDRGPLPVQEAVAYLLQACEAMAEAHAKGIVHRDLKPGNLFVAKRPDGRPVIKVLDFGISKLTTDGDSSMTRTRGGMGSPLYISPEQFESAKNVTHATDIWALGAVLYELLSGVAAFAASSIPEVYARIMADPPPRITPLRSDVPPGLERVVQKCLEHSPKDRYLTVADLAMALEPYAPASAVGFAASAVRLIQASPLAHAGLPEVKASMPPPGISSNPPRDAPTVPDRAAELSALDTHLGPARARFVSGHADTVAASTPGSATASTWTAATLAAHQKRRRIRTFAVGGGLLLIAGIATALFAFSRPDAEVAADREPARAPSQAPPLAVAATLPVVGVASAKPSASAAPSVSAARSASPPPVHTTHVAAPAATAKPEKPHKPPPAKPASTSGDDLLQYRR
ncbi:MAG: serine/threonine protein kinase [Polyangiaceae bacterium]|nr:serine/threonine protein kinase [Polyangiaceae bacterium]